jgi:hypothetical protein
MDNDLSMTLMAAQTVATPQSAALAMVKKSHEMEVQIAQVVEKTARVAPPPPGQGRVVDKLA